MMNNKKRDMTPFDMKKKPCKQAFYLLPVVWVASFLLTRRYGLTIDRNGIKGLKPPYLVISTHQGFSDYYIAPLSVFPHRASYVSDMEGFAAFGDTLYRKVGCIGTRRFATDVCTLYNIKYALHKNKNIVFLFPEARHSNDGTTSLLPDNLGKLVKYLNVPVAVLTVHGSYLASPFWDEAHSRKTKISAQIKLMYTKEEIINSAEEEISEKIASALQYNEYKWQYDNKIKIDYKDRACGLSQVLYQCIRCGKEFVTSDKGAELFCGNCGAAWEMTEYGQLKDKKGDVVNIPDWYSWERDNVKKEVIKENYQRNFKVDIQALPNENGFVNLGKGLLVHDRKGFSLDFSDSGEHLFFSASILYTVQTEYDYKGRGKCLVLSTKDCCYYLYSKEPEFNPTWLQFAAEIIHIEEKKKQKRRRTMTEFIAMNENELHNLKEFAAPIWRECYEGIVSVEHTETLIAKYFDFENIQGFLKEGMIYQNIVVNGKRAGFIAFCLNGDHLYLDKLYLLKEYRGRHISTSTFKYLADHYGLPIRLNVNRSNEQAIRAYKGNGFKVIKKEEIPQKGGFVNCDYVMERI